MQLFVYQLNCKMLTYYNDKVQQQCPDFTELSLPPIPRNSSNLNLVNYGVWVSISKSYRKHGQQPGSSQGKDSLQLE